MDFKQQKIFENNTINEICDVIFNKVNKTFNKTTDIIICGSVAKIFSGTFADDYQAKDLDFVVRDYFVWRFLRENLQKWFPNFQIEIRMQERVILYTGIIAIEFWAGNKDNRPTEHKTKNIKYINHGSTI